MKIKLSVSILFLMFAAAAFGKTTGLSFIQDNYPKALAEAKHRNLPIFVECWAPW